MATLNSYFNMDDYSSPIRSSKYFLNYYGQDYYDSETKVPIERQISNLETNLKSQGVNVPAQVERSPLDRLIDAISITSYPIMGALRNSLDSDYSTTAGQGFMSGIKASNPFGEGYTPGEVRFSDVEDALGWKKQDNPNGKWYNPLTWNANNVMHGVTGFTGDVLLDPLTYFSGGLKPLLQGSGKSLFKGGAKSAEREAAEQTFKNTLKELEESGKVKNILNNYDLDSSEEAVQDLLRKTGRTSGYVKPESPLEWGIGSNKMHIASDSTMRNIGDKTGISYLYNTAKEGLSDNPLTRMLENKYGFNLGKKLSEKFVSGEVLKARKAAKENPEEYMDYVAFSRYTNNLHKTYAEMQNQFKTRSEELFKDLSEESQKTMTKIMETPGVFKNETKTINTGKIDVIKTPLAQDMYDGLVKMRDEVQDKINKYSQMKVLGDKVTEYKDVLKNINNVLKSNKYDLTDLTNLKSVKHLDFVRSMSPETQYEFFDKYLNADASNIAQDLSKLGVENPNASALEIRNIIDHSLRNKTPEERKYIVGHMFTERVDNPNLYGVAMSKEDDKPYKSMEDIKKQMEQRKRRLIKEQKVHNKIEQIKAELIEEKKPYVQKLIPSTVRKQNPDIDLSSFTKQQWRVAYAKAAEELNNVPIKKLKQLVDDLNVRKEQNYINKSYEYGIDNKNIDDVFEKDRSKYFDDLESKRFIQKPYAGLDENSNKINNMDEYAMYLDDVQTYDKRQKELYDEEAIKHAINNYDKNTKYISVDEARQKMKGKTFSNNIAKQKKEKPNYFEQKTNEKHWLYDEDQTLIDMAHSALEKRGIPITDEHYSDLLKRTINDIKYSDGYKQFKENKIAMSKKSDEALKTEKKFGTSYNDKEFNKVMQSAERYGSAVKRNNKDISEYRLNEILQAKFFDPSQGGFKYEDFVNAKLKKEVEQSFKQGKTRSQIVEELNNRLDDFDIFPEEITYGKWEKNRNSLEIGNDKEKYNIRKKVNINNIVDNVLDAKPMKGQVAFNGFVKGTPLSKVIESTKSPIEKITALKPVDDIVQKVEPNGEQINKLAGIEGKEKEVVGEPKVNHEVKEEKPISSDSETVKKTNTSDSSKTGRYFDFDSPYAKNYKEMQNPENFGKNYGESVPHIVTNKNGTKILEEVGSPQGAKVSDVIPGLNKLAKSNPKIANYLSQFNVRLANVDSDIAESVINMERPKWNPDTKEWEGVRKNTIIIPSNSKNPAKSAMHEFWHGYAKDAGLFKYGDNVWMNAMKADKNQIYDNAKYVSYKQSQDDFVDSMSMYLNNPNEFKMKFPERANVIEKSIRDFKVPKAGYVDRNVESKFFKMPKNAKQNTQELIYKNQMAEKKLNKELLEGNKSEKEYISEATKLDSQIANNGFNDELKDAFEKTYPGKPFQENVWITKEETQRVLDTDKVDMKKLFDKDSEEAIKVINSVKQTFKEWGIGEGLKEDDLLEEYVPHILRDSLTKEDKELLKKEGLNFDDKINYNALKRKYEGSIEKINADIERTTGKKDMFENILGRIYLERGLKHNYLVFEKKFYDKLVSRFGNEVNVVKDAGSKNVYASIEDIKKALSLSDQNGKITMEELLKEYKLPKDIIPEPGTKGTMFKPIVKIDADTFNRLKAMDDGFKGFTMPDLLAEYTNNIGKVMMDDTRGTFLKVYDHFLQLFKINATAVNPGFHVRNYISNQFQNYLAVGDKIFDPKLHYYASKMISKDEEYLTNTIVKDVNGKAYTLKEIRDAMAEHGASDNGRFANDFKNIAGTPGNPLDEITKAVNKKGISLQKEVKNANGDMVLKPDLQTLNPISQKFVPYQAGYYAGSKVEGHARAMNFLANVMNGKDYYEAAENVNKFLFDYDSLSGFEKNIMKRLVPFYTWMRKNMPLQLEQSMFNTNAYRNVAKIMDEMKRNVPEDQRVEQKDMNKFARDWIQLAGNVKGKDSKGKPTKEPIFINPNLPFADLNKLAPKDIFTTLISSSTPAIKLPLELGMNTNMYFNSPISRGIGDRDEAPAYLQPLLGGTKDNPATIDPKLRYMLRNIVSLENISKDIGTQGDEQITNIMNNLSGIKTYSYDVDKYKEWAQKDRLKQLKDLQKLHKQKQQ